MSESKNTIDTDAILEELISSFEHIGSVLPGQIPNIDLYMDQITSFMDEQLSSTKRYDSDKVLTKTMINNYTKNKLLPPPIKKKYSKNHLLLLIFIYYLKNFLCIKDIDAVLKPLKENYFDSGSAIGLDDIYARVYTMVKAQLPALNEGVKEAHAQARETFQDLPEEDADTLTTFGLLCSLCFDIYVKKMMVERIIDEVSEERDD